MAKEFSDGVYRRPDREGYWITWIDAQGRRRRRKTNVKTLFQARAARAAELQRVERAKALGFTPPGEETFEAVATRFLAHQKARLTPRAYEREKGIVQGHLTKFFNIAMASLRRVDVQRYITKRAPEASAHSVQKELNTIKHICRLVVEWEIIPFNPAQGVKAPKVPAGRVRYLQPGELRNLLEMCPLWLRPIVGLAVSTGMRRGEILGLRWLDVDSAHARIMLPQTKNGEGRIIYLNQFALSALASISSNGAKPTDPVFTDCTPEQVSIAFVRLCRTVLLPPTLADSATFVFARDADYFFGVLHSRLHQVWGLHMGTALEDRPRYTPTSTFEFGFVILRRQQNKRDPQAPCSRGYASPKAVTPADEGCSKIDLAAPSNAVDRLPVGYCAANTRAVEELPLTDFLLLNRCHFLVNKQKSRDDCPGLSNRKFNSATG